MHEEIPNIDRLALLEKERLLIVPRLVAFVGPDAAERISHELVDIALTIDGLVQEIRSHPNIKRDYTYNGKAFINRNTGANAFIWDGLTLLRNLNLQDVLESYLRQPGADNLMNMMEENRKTAEGKLRVLKERGDINFDPDIIGEVIEHDKEKEKKDVDKFIEGLEREIGDDADDK